MENLENWKSTKENTSKTKEVRDFRETHKKVEDVLEKESLRTDSSNLEKNIDKALDLAFEERTHQFSQVKGNEAFHGKMTDIENAQKLMTEVSQKLRMKPSTLDAQMQSFEGMDDWV